MDFSQFDKKVDLEGLTKEIAEAEKNGFDGDYPEVPKGKYEVAFEKIEMRATKKDNRPMLSVMARILEGEYKKSCVFMNRVLFGTKNDANMINSAVGWLKNLGTNLNIEFESYSQFDALVMDVAEAVDGNLEYIIEYDPDAFNTISIKEVFEVE
jgi:hypothetical protein